MISNGWNSVVVDPAISHHLHKFKDIETGKRIKISEDDLKIVPRKVGIFETAMVKDFDLVVGLHAHGSNIQILEACAKYKKDFLLVPCCVIDEPINKVPGINWFESLVEYSKKLGFNTKTDILNFKGKNKILYSMDYLW